MNKNILVILAALALPALASAERPLEPVLNINAKEAQTLLGEPVMESVLFVAAAQAEELLGDQDVGFSLDQINSLPATASGHGDILFINPEAAEMLLGETLN